MVATSGVHAAAKPQVLRGSLDKEDVLVEVEATCQEGFGAGQMSVWEIWEDDMDSNCDNIWGLEDAADDMKDDEYPENASNWKDQAYNDCARDGVDHQVDHYEEECLGDDPSQCQDLGETAAEIIVFDNVCVPDMSGSAYGNAEPDYKETCREVAYGICTGYISTTINKYCSDSNVSTSELLELQNKCEDQVDSMVGADELEFMIN